MWSFHLRDPQGRPTTLLPSMRMTRPAANAATSAFLETGSDTSVSTSIAIVVVPILKSIGGAAFATVCAGGFCCGLTAHVEQTMLR